ncbi:hypothetical protein ACH4C6_14175 [Streptomyces sp. NPDC017943]|uniref:hypothetical protein n=1 Tax=Streptomyces sp. NPDC017943 TaxID=3365019 RepID=UPI003790C648
MKAGQAGRTLARGTWFSFEAWARWLSGASHKDRSGVVRLAVVVVRLVLSLLAAMFYAGTLTYAPHLIYAAPVVWAVTAWHMSDSSATPPPLPPRPSCRECAGHELVGGTPSEPQKGMLIYTVADPERPNHTHVHVEHSSDA